LKPRFILRCYRGSKDATQRASKLFKDTIDQYEAPSLEADRLEEIDVFVKRRELEGGADIER